MKAKIEDIVRIKIEQPDKKSPSKKALELMIAFLGDVERSRVTYKELQEACELFPDFVASVSVPEVLDMSQTRR